MTLKIAIMLNKIFPIQYDEQNLRQILHGECFDLPLTRYQTGVLQCLFSKYEPRTHRNYYFFFCNFGNICYNFIACCSQCSSALSSADNLLSLPCFVYCTSQVEGSYTLVTTHI